jgi:uncharacterized membrane protein SirB2
MNLFSHNEPWIWLSGLFLFLTLYAVVTVIFINKRKETASPGRLATVYLALKTVRLLLYAGAILCYLLVVNVERQRFVLVAVGMYFIYLLLDTLFLTATEKRLNKK